MNLALFTLDGFLFFLRWLHIFFGVTWIGLLYYFNFVQGAFFAETDAATKSNAIQKLVPRALWWFRWGAFWTMATGLTIIGGRAHQLGSEAFASSWGVTILTGASMGLIMGANVWFVIWPNQKIVIASATAAATGGQANPAAGPAGARALLASRTNTLLSVPMLFFMAAARNLSISISETAQFGLLTALIALVLVVIEINALKGTKTGILTTIKGVITSGFVLTAGLYVLIEVLL